MSVIVLVLGILVCGAGAILVGFGIPISGLAIGQTLIIAGAIALVGGLVLVGLGIAIALLRQIVEGLKGRPASRTGRVAAAVQRAEEVFPDPRVAEVRPPEARLMQPRAEEPRLPEPGLAEPLAAEPAQAANSTVVASASAIERLRATMGRPERATDVEEVPLSPNGGQHAPAPAPLDAAPEQKSPEPVARSAASVDTPKEPRLDFLFRSRPTRPAQPESFDALWPKRSPRATADQPKVEEAGTLAVEAPAPVSERRAAQRQAAPATEDTRPSVAILKSGVVDGMAYTLYADGSIEAQLPQGTVRFGSIAELRAHIENNS